jgi:secreted trypsin-like serine protease
MAPRAGTLLLVLVALSVPVAACVNGVPTALSRRPIINGQVDEEHSAVVALTAWGEQFCTGTVIAPRAILTAGHCVEESGINPRDMKAFFGTTVGGAGSQVSVTAAKVHPQYYIRGDGAPMYDVAVLTLAQDAPVTPMKWQRTPLSDLSGSLVTLVGYGVTNAQRQTGNGTRRVVDESVMQMDEMFIYYGGGASGTCQGDSGGPMFLDVDGTLVLVGITSWGDQSCVQLGGNTRVDVFAGFIAPLAPVTVNLAVTSPTEGDIVGSSFTVTADATSDAGLAEVDVLVDGEIAGAAVEPPYTFSVSGLSDGEHVIMVRATGTDSAVGVASVHVTVATLTVGDACSDGAQCGSGLCADADSGNGFCTQACETNADCPNDAACNVVAGGNLCGPPGSAAGGCQAGGSSAGAGLGLLLLGLALGLAGARRRR